MKFKYWWNSESDGLNGKSDDLELKNVLSLLLLLFTIVFDTDVGKQRE